MKLVVAVLAVLAAAAGAGYASPVWAQTGQQGNLKSCTAETEGRKLTGAARKSSVEACVSRKEPVAPSLSPQQKFRSCTMKAAEQNLPGDARATSSWQTAARTEAQMGARKCRRLPLFWRRGWDSTH